MDAKLKLQHKLVSTAARLGLMVVLLTALLAGQPAPPAWAATPGLPFSEDFADTNLRDSSRTDANWSTGEQALILAWRQKRFGAFGPGIGGTNITNDAHSTYAVALGDVDGDGDLDLVAGNYSQANRLYLNNGDGTFAAGSDITADAHTTRAVALGDVDGDGDLDLVVGNSLQANRLYPNNGTADPFSGVTGSDITADAYDTITAALGDVDGDGDLDLVAGNYSQANRLYLNNGDGTFAAGSDITADAARHASVALGDVDGDGDLDLVVGSLLAANRLYLNNGDGTFAAGSNITADAYDTASVALGDVDGDGDLDVVAGNITNQVNRLYLNNGNGTFAAGSNITADTHSTYAVALGDVDGDGDFDLVAGNNGTNRLYLNNGTADPFNGVSGRDITADAHNTAAVALGDVDGDGDLDLAAGNNGQANRLYLNNSMSNPFNGISGRDITADAHDTRNVALGDVDGDGDLDLVAGNWSRANRLYLNNGTADPFSGVTGSNITADVHDTRALALGDVDGDGDLDLVAGNYGQANRLYLNNGDGTFAAGSDITTDAHWTTSVALGDVDGDGDLDLVAGNEGQANRLYLNNGTATPFNGVSGTDVTADAHNTISAALGDVDGDGDLDLAAGNWGQANRLYLNNGTADPFNGVSGTDVTADVYQTVFVALGDVDGDGDLDLAAGNYSQANRLYLNNGTATPFAGVTGSDITADAHLTNAVALGDADGDGDLDLAAGNLTGQANRLYLNNGTADPFAGVSGADVTADAHSTYAVALGDVDRDGDLDLMAGNEGVNRLYLNNGTPSPTTGWAGDDVSADVRNTYAVALGDVDGDGDLDLVAGNTSNQANRLYLNNGTADPFAGVSGSNITADAHNTFDVALGDVDGDGDLDLVAGNYSTSQANRLYLNNGTADPFAGVTGSDITADAHNTWSVALGDVDGDGDLDLVAGNNNQANRLYLNNGTADPFAGVSGTNITADAHSTYAVALGDVDGDGDLDLVAGNLNQVNRLYLNNGDGTFAAGSDITADAHYTVSVALGDVDGDGDLDLVAGNGLQADRLYLNNGGGVPWSPSWSGSDITAGAHQTWSVALGDVDNDGDLDLVTGSDGQANRLYLNNGTAAPFAGVIGSDITADAHGTMSVALGDVDGDGDLDLVAGNDAQAHRLYRRMLYHTAHGRATSVEVDTESINISNATLTPAAILPANTRVEYWLSNNGGARWFLVQAGVNFAFPTADSDLRWRAELHSLSPVRTPRITEIAIASERPDLAIVKSASPGGAAPGETITYTLTFSNAGTWAATGVVITDVVPISMAVTSVLSSGVPITDTGASPAYVWDVGHLGVGQGGIITISGVLSNPLAAGTFTNTATIACAEKEGSGDNNSASAKVTVQNVAPEISEGDSTAVTMDEDGSPMPFSLILHATDANGGALTWSIHTPAGHGTASAGGTGTSKAIAYAPAADYAGSDSFVVQVSDGTLMDTIAVNVTLDPVNDAPTFTSTPVTAATKDVAYSYTVIADDVDVGDVLTITAPTLPTWLALTDHGDGTATLSGTPDDADTGSNSVVLQVTDGTETALQPFTIAVQDTYDVFLPLVVRNHTSAP